MRITEQFGYAITLISCFLLFTCEEDSDPIPDRDFKQDMREFIQAISSNARDVDSNFIIIPQNGHELLTADGEETGSPAMNYISSIDGVGREDLFYGYDDDNEASFISDRNYMINFMDIAEENNIEVLTTDYCWTHDKMDDSYSQNMAKGYISFAAEHRELDNIPAYPSTPFNVNSDAITSIDEAKNFLYLLNPEGFNSKDQFLQDLRMTNYDVIILDLYFQGSIELTSTDIVSLKTKSDGGSRLIIAYMSIGEAEDYRFYWKSSWNNDPPSWLEEENPLWAGNYKVRYWEAEWQKLIYGEDYSYLTKILTAGFDGAYLDIIDAFEYFER
ncbi:MAG: endo alpha-1,4 polygalactosaminidase [Candidatus Marinimicrobia bacterium]|nr:endo alpha-1,4 polygalactosaminidase [Candidatus Neomarinimicrobiota bacterium]